MTRTQRLTLAATGLGLFMIYLDALIVNVALPSIQHDFAVGEAGLQWVVAAYSLGMAVAIMSAGTLAESSAAGACTCSTQDGPHKSTTQD